MSSQTRTAIRQMKATAREIESWRQQKEAARVAPATLTPGANASLHRQKGRGPRQPSLDSTFPTVSTTAGRLVEIGTLDEELEVAMLDPRFPTVTRFIQQKH